MSDLLPELDKLKKAGLSRRAKEAFDIGQCVQCHRFGDAGGSVGPELTAVSSRLSSRDILESILEPSKVVSEQFQNTIFTLKDGADVTGRVADENDQRLIVVTDPRKLTKVEVRKANIESRYASKISPMPGKPGRHIDQKEILDLIAYLQSGGSGGLPAFQK